MNQKGFSAPELMVVGLLVAVTLAITGPRLSGWMGSTGLRGAVDEFSTAHSLARTAAVQTGRVARLRIEATAGRFWVEVDTGFIAGVRDTVDVVKRLSGAGVTMSSNRSLLCFDSRGLPTTRGGCQPHDATLVFRFGEQADTIRITPLGRILR